MPPRRRIIVSIRMSLLVLQTALSPIHLVHVGIDVVKVDRIAVFLLTFQLLNIDIVSFS